MFPAAWSKRSKAKCNCFPYTHWDVCASLCLSSPASPVRNTQNRLDHWTTLDHLRFYRPSAWTTLGPPLGPRDEAPPSWASRNEVEAFNYTKVEAFNKHES